ncbi:MAG TPA: GNAT family N-acetyltransferase [Solirubrobacterales bacterium]|nr:GNAT family N-acetyltransferase [Solirubrobacterales bacterium]
MGREERQTRRLLARRPTPEDRVAYHAHFNQPAVESWLRPSPLARFDVRSLDELLEGDCAHWEDHGFGPWVLETREGGRFAGRGGLAWASVEGLAEVELPWSVEPVLHGQGFATEAAAAAIEWAREIGFESVVALVLPANLASRRVAEKTGFTIDGECEHAGMPHLLFRLHLR